MNISTLVKKIKSWVASIDKKLDISNFITYNTTYNKY